MFAGAQHVSAQQQRSMLRNVLAGFTFAALCGILGVTARFVRHPFGWEAITMEWFKLPVIVAVFRMAWRQEELSKETVLFARFVMLLSLLSDMVFLLAVR